MSSPDWIIREVDYKDCPRGIILDKNSGLVCCTPENDVKNEIPEKSKLRAIGVWSNESWDCAKLRKPMVEIARRLGIEIHKNDDPDLDLSEPDKDYQYEHIDRREPAEISWNPDFTLICPDRDVLISRKCLMQFSKVLGPALENDKECRSLEISWRSTGIIHAMNMIHFSKCLQLCRVVMSTGSYTQDTLEFAFTYDISFVMSIFRKAFIDLIPKVERTISWLPFFHKFNNSDGTNVFAAEIDAIISSIVTPSRLEKYLELRSGKTGDDYIKHDHDIMRAMARKLNHMNECD